MDIKRAKQYVLDTVRAYLQVDADGMKLLDPKLQRPLFLVGPPGIGKTAIISQVAHELGIGLVSYSMTHHTRQSALGLPLIEHHDYKGFEYDASEYTMSEIISSIYEYMDRSGIEQGILFLDEINCVSETLYPSMLQFLQFKTFGKHEVPDGWVIACAGNPPEYNRSVHEFDIATMDRLRKIEIEPDINAWKTYAANAGVHPAVMSFLEIEPDCFYRVESTPKGKKFATARGWDDLSHMIELNEHLDIPIEQDLVEQFIQDPDLSEQFALYYDLFRKYRSDYQIPSILSGDYSAEIVERAQAAQFDERMALMGLLLDAVAPSSEEILVQERALTAVRDDLRIAKVDVMSGRPVDDVLAPSIEELENQIRRFEEIGAAGNSDMRVLMRARSMLRECVKAPVLQGCKAGEECFDAMHQEFRGFVGAFEKGVSTLREQLENSYSFLEEAFGDGHEIFLFTTELTARRATTLFISRYGCEGYARHSGDLQLADTANELERRIEQTIAGNDATGKAFEQSSALEGESGEQAGERRDIGAARHGELGSIDPTPSQEDLGNYYKDACWEFGYASLCHMALPADLAGKTVLDIGCRRGKGVFKLSERVGARGHAIGVDWVESHVSEALDRMERAARETGLPSNNMEFQIAYPEDLLVAGIGGNTVDVVFVNSILHLTMDPKRVLSEISRVLKPGGLLICEVALADGDRDVSVVQEARKLGNSIQASPSKDSFEKLLEEIGFDVSIVEGPIAVKADMGFKHGHSVPTANSDEPVSFDAFVLHAVKR